MRLHNATTTSALLRRALPALAIVIAATLVIACGEQSDQRDYVMPPADDDRPYTLVDLRHTEIQNPVDYRLHRDQYNYQGTYGFHRLFEHLEDNDYPWIASDTHLTPARLEPFDILFINLVHDRMDDFTDNEVQAIKDFVHDGGGLFVIGDHTNVYRHAERVNRFLKPMGLEMMYHTVTDQPPFYSVSGLGWIMMFDFADHPINDGVEMLSFKTGGPIAADDPDDHLAFTSEDGFADYWDERDDGGYYGTWSQGDDKQLEPSGPLSVASATKYGDGRAVLVGDQNIFGDAWLNLGHNFEFATNSFEWLAHNEETDRPIRDEPRKGHNIAFESHVSHYQTARNDGPGDGYYTFFIETNRNEALTARATPGVETKNTDTLFFLSSDIHFGEEELDDRTYSDSDLDEISDFLESGGQAVITFEPDNIPEPTIGLLEHLLDGFAIEFGDQIWEPGDEATPTPTELDGVHDIDSSHFTVDDLALTSLPSYEFPSNDDYRDGAGGFSESDFEFYLYDVRAQGGAPFVEAHTAEGDTITVAQKFEVGDGELIVFIQDGFWRNRTLGDDELLEPKSFFRTDIVEFQHRFLDYLRGV